VPARRLSSGSTCCGKTQQYPEKMVDECIILAESPAALVELSGISVLERLLRTLQRCGITRAIILSSTADVIAREVASPSWARAQIHVTVRNREPGAVTVEQIVDVWPPHAQSLLVLRGDTVFDARLLRVLAAQNQSAVLIDRAPAPVLVELVASAPEMAGAKFGGAAVVDHDWAAARSGSFEENLRRDLATEHIVAIDVAAEPSYSREMRRDLRPFWFPAPAHAEKKKLAERLLLRSAQKGAQDLPAWIHAPIENFLISRLSKTSVTPNPLTFFSNVVAWTATILFATGRLGWGLVVALVVGVLDGLDGKQARLKVETTKHGKLEHWFDALFEWSWWITLAYHVQKTGQLSAAFGYLFLLICAEAVAALAKWSVVRFCGRSIDELSDFSRAVRLVGGRRNIYIWILALGILLGTPGQAFMLMAWWGAVTAAVQVPCAAFALWVRWRQSAKAS